MLVSSNAADITAIRRPDGTYVSAVEPLGIPGVARQLTAGATSANTALTATCRRVSMRASNASLRFEVGSSSQTANASTSHYLNVNERIDIALPATPNIAIIRDDATDAVLELTEFL